MPTTMKQTEPAGEADHADTWTTRTCTCPPECASAFTPPCKGECGCERCHNDYGDFLSSR